jgi:hypothetical protein
MRFGSKVFFGLIAAACTTLSVHAAGAEDLSFVPFAGSYAPGETVGWTVSLAPGAAPAPGSYSYTIIENEKTLAKTGSFDLKSGSAKITVRSDKPATVRVVVDYLAPPPPAPPSPASLQKINAAFRTLVVKADPTLADVMAKYANYPFISWNWNAMLSAMNENRVATLTARIAPR